MINCFSPCLTLVFDVYIGYTGDLRRVQLSLEQCSEIILRDISHYQDVQVLKFR
jgi:hypothetical protein